MKKIIFAEKKLGWGKHKDLTGSQVYGADPGYLMWAAISEFAEIDPTDMPFCKAVGNWIALHPREEARLRRTLRENGHNPEGKVVAKMNDEGPKSPTTAGPTTAEVNAAWGSW